MKYYIQSFNYDVDGLLEISKTTWEGLWTYFQVYGPYEADGPEHPAFMVVDVTKPLE